MNEIKMDRIARASRREKAMLFKEDKQTELKLIVADGFLKTVSAFANFEGGRILFGVDDAGNPVGLQNVKGDEIKIEDMINDRISPRPRFEITTRDLSGKSVIELKIYKGENTPFMYKNKTYQRANTSTIAADDFTLRTLILKGIKRSFEELDSDEQGLTFSKLETALKEKIGIEELSLDVMKSLGLYKNNLYNNAAALLADNNTLKGTGVDMVRFGETESIFLDRVTEKGNSLLTQYEKGLEFFDKWYAPYEVVIGFYRESRIHIPKEAYREALSNFCAHRDFSKSAMTKIACYDDRIEISSPGGLPDGLSEEEFLDGRVSQLRNEIVSNVFHRLGIIEKFATGIKRIKREYSPFAQEPIFKVYENSITVILPCVVYDSADSETSGMKLDDVILELLKEQGELSRAEMEELTNIKGRTIRDALKKLLDKKLITRIGGGRSTKYKA